MPKPTRNTPQEEKKPQTPAPDANAYTWGDEEATGFEGTRAEDFGIAFLNMIQKGSPEVDDTHKDYPTKKIEGARPGFVVNTLTKQVVYDKDEKKPLLVVPMFHEKLYQEWKPKSQGGSFVKSHPSPVILTQCKRSEKNEDVLPNGNIIRTTSYFSLFLLTDGITDMKHEDESKRPTRVILPMSSTQLKKARAWLNMMDAIKINGRTPPMYSHIYALSAVPESNEKGSWMGWKIEIYRTLNLADVTTINEAKQVAVSSAKSSGAALLTAGSGAEDEHENTEADELGAEANRKAARAG